ncbi:MAG: class I SAM-dependent methyltransferase [Chloroflexi bacterium]|nr:class I SAM-dependent methyltransferase [Chloroflexota bacterium]
MSMLERIYRRSYSDWQSGEPSDGESHSFEALKLFALNSKQSLLDIGCFNGAKTAIIRDYLGADRAAGVDFIEGALEVARQRGIDARKCDINEDAIPFEDDLFDCIHLGDVIEHVVSPDHLLKESMRLLHPGGYVVLTTPNMASWRNRLGLLAGWQPLGTEVSTAIRVGSPFSPEGGPAGHLRIFTPRALIELSRYYGFETEVMNGYSVSPQKPEGVIRRGFSWADTLAAALRPTLCDELAVRLRKPGRR